ncbi:HpcH/HpaI aldolase/citrate lyase family protein [Allonocardiopsis opalescens]|uniref:Citrate lyase subunit beta/citryl-CoA lyase n=1 Tax=Allonocardiopsis opalescens TaxID=1144618 RepID=A0A2T0Q3A1_9ACTN|nr:CoA ester lyase [Allonocardiopsis opalescens]PRX98148.1 citrate lyase subunit beta/citryl-CoA lyase [Allonocardiopsis opalescens]
MLFVPGTRPDWAAKAVAAGADAVIMDLEDAVRAADKASARGAVAAVVAEQADASDGAALLVRINDLSSWAAADDVRAVVRAGLSGVVLPKVSGPADVAVAARLLDWAEAEAGLPAGSVALVPLLETASGLRSAYEVAAESRRVACLGALSARDGDIERALGFRWSAEGTETLALRSRVLLDARAAGVPNPVTGLWTDIADLGGLRRFAEQNRALGYDGMMAIHPTHVPVINEVFSPDAATLDRDRRLLAALDASGEGAVVFEGVMIDEAMAATARDRLRRYGGGG